MATAFESKNEPDIFGAARDPVQIEKRRRAQLKKRWMKRGFGLVLAAALVAALVYAARPRPVAVELATVRVGLMQVTIDEAGRTRVLDRYAVLAPLGGDLARITLRPGDKIEAGALLAQILPQTPALLDPRSRAEATARLASAQAASQQARANVTHAQLALEHAHGDAERMKGLGASGAVSPDAAAHAEFESNLRAQELASARFGAAVASHQVEMARAALARYGDAAKGREAFDIVSPIAGRVLRVVQSSAGMVSPSTPLIELGDPTELEVIVDVLTEDAVRIPPKAKVVLDRWGGQWPLAAHVRIVEPSAFTRLSALGVEEQRVSIVIDFDEPIERYAELGDGYRVEAHIVTWQKDGVIIAPSSAVFRQRDGWATFIASQGRAHLRMVGIGHRSASDVEVTSGLAGGDQVVIHPSDKVEDGVRIATVIATAP
jgi:HlyD family secretion protein